ncbi:MAG: hypothetical protein IPM46_11585 [Flavobacteriales bacterium]|nr:hypothetical protein [Flavobacteriales bacterium]
MRSILLPFAFLPFSVMACTAFKVTQDGRTIVGLNEDAWSINAQVRFEQGRNGGYGAIYFAHFNGHPMRVMNDQMGMNEAGLVFDGLVVGPGTVKRRTGMPAMETSDAINHVMRTCATVHEVEVFLRTVNTGPMAGMLFFCDAAGGYLVVEPDTMLLGHDPWYAVSNWRMSNCSDPATIPIPRLQNGRQLLTSGSGASPEEAEEVLSTMAACRAKLGEGTLFSVLFDPTEGQAHLYFYHDFSERLTFNLEEELTKGDHRVDMASLFGPRPEYEKLRAYVTPFHQRWLFWAMLGWLGLALLIGAASFVHLCTRIILRLRRRAAGSLMVPLLGASTTALVALLLGVLLMQEGPYYFGLGDVHPALVWAPVLIALIGIAWLGIAKRSDASRLTLLIGSAFLLPLLSALTYWGMLLP